MKPIYFKEHNKLLRKPDSMTEEECGNLHVFTDGDICVSCWKPSIVERLSILVFGKVWLYVFSGETQPPVALEGSITAFKQADK